MKVCLVADGLPGFHKEWSGAEMVCLRLSELLKQNGQRVIFITTKFDIKREFSEEIYQIPTPLNRISFLFREFPVDLISLLFSLKVLKKTKPHIIHLHSKILFFSVLISAKILKIPVVLSVLDHWVICPKETLMITNNRVCTSFHGKSYGKSCVKCFPKNVAIPEFAKKLISYLRYRIFDYSLKKIDRIIAFSKTSKKLLVEAGISDEKIEVIYPYQPALKLAKASTKFNEPTIIFVGWLRPYKGLDVVIRAMSYIIKEIPNAKLIAIGSGEKEYEQYIRKLINSLNLNKNVLLLGKKENKEVLNFIMRGDVVVVPEQWPNVFGPVVLVEAMALGKPVVASRIGGIPEFIKNGENGFTVTYNRPVEFAEKIVYLLKNRKIAENIGDNAAHSITFLRSENSIQKILNLYTSLYILLFEGKGR